MIRVMNREKSCKCEVCPYLKGMMDIGNDLTEVTCAKDKCEKKGGK